MAHLDATLVKGGKLDMYLEPVGATGKLTGSTSLVRKEELTLLLLPWVTLVQVTKGNGLPVTAWRVR